MSVSSSERAVNSPSSVDCERARNVERARRVSAERERRAGKHRYETTRWLTTGRGKVWDEASGAYRAVGVAAAVAVAGTFREVAHARPGGGDRDDGLRRVSQDVVAPFVGGDGVHGQSVGPDRVRGLRLRLDAGHQDSQREHQRERVRGSTRHRALRYARHLSVREEAARCARDFHNRWRKAPHQRLFARRDYSSSESESRANSTTASILPTIRCFELSNALVHGVVRVRVVRAGASLRRPRVVAPNVADILKTSFGP